MSTITKNAEDLTDFHSIANFSQGKPARVTGVILDSDSQLVILRVRPEGRLFNEKLVMRFGETVKVIV